MDPDETAICEFLKPWPGEFVAAQQICRQADGRRRFETDPKWALVPLARLVDNGTLETDGSGRYRLPSGGKDKSQNLKRWISPQIKKILASQGKLPDSDSDI
jgi:hypothetical protein